MKFASGEVVAESAVYLKTIPKQIEELVFSSPRFADFIPAPSLPCGRPCSPPARNSPADCFSRRGSLLSFKQGSASRASFRLDKICEFGFENSRFFNLFGYKILIFHFQNTLQLLPQYLVERMIRPFAIDLLNKIVFITDQQNMSYLLTRPPFITKKHCFNAITYALVTLLLITAQGFLENQVTL